MTITVQTVFTDPDVLASDSLAGDLLKLGSLRQWFSFDERFAPRVNGSIPTLVDRKGSGASLAQATVGKQAVPATALIGPAPAAGVGVFTAANQTNYAWAGPPQDDLTKPFTWAFTFKPGDTSAVGNLFGSLTSGSIRAVVNYNLAGAARVVFQFGTVSLIIPINLTAWNAIIVSYDGTNLKAWVNGVAVASVAASGAPGSGGLRLGALSDGASQFWDGQMRDVMLFSGDLFSVAPAVNLLKAYFANAYGIG